MAPERIDPRVEGLGRLALVGGTEGMERPFFMDRFEVTRGQFAAYLSALGKSPPPQLRKEWGGARPSPAQEDWPVTRVSPSQALAFARWRGMRLPRLKEWEWAVGIRGGKKESFPWGEEFDRAHWDELKCNTAELGLGRPANVGTFELGATRGTRIYDLVGNVAEWVRLPPSYPSSLGEGASPGERPAENLALRFSLEACLLAFPGRVPSWWAGLFPVLAPLGRREWEALQRPWAWVGWSYASRMERVGHTIPGRVSPRKGWEEWASTVGFRCAADPEELWAWFLSRNGPSLEGATGKTVARFLARFREVFLPLLRKSPLRAGDPTRRKRISSLLQ
ncbi:MAG TPA: formylglycine-generating enzyme family protein [Planctomycetes bacterium]|nr:formylglycine-generating enzyme family protein [Planctomycetota bacterium]